MGRKVDLTGQRFGMWTVIGDSGERGHNGGVMWECICDCGTQRNVRGDRFKSNMFIGCGCKKNEDLTGEKFGKLTVLTLVRERRGGRRVWKCRCECGKYTEVVTDKLKQGNIRSCGCIKRLDLTEHRFGRLVAIHDTGKSIIGVAVWDCLCDCGRKKEVRSNALMSGNTKSCGCLNTEKRLARYGKNHPNYDPNKTDEERLKRRYTFNYGSQRIWSKQIMERDNYTCQICNKGGNLNAHHLNGWNAFPEQRFDLDNGVTLCADCHKEFHSEYGYGDNTREQFDEYAAGKALVLN